MAIAQDEVLALMNAFHDVSMTQKGTADAQAAFFLRPESAQVFVPHGEDFSMQTNYEIHQRLTDERHVPLQPWEITQLCADPERARAVGAVYWEGRPVGGDDDQLIKVIVGEDWIVQRVPGGALKIVLYINAYHYFLPDSAQIELG
jgi:hypothetical protein